MTLLDRAGVRVTLLAIMAAGILLSCWNAPIYRFDDEPHVRLALDHSAADWFRLQIDTTYMPVTLFSFWIDASVFGRGSASVPTPGQTAPEPSTFNGNGPAMRLMSGVYHLMAGFVLWQLLRRLGASTGLAAFVALVWCGHPMACESVCWISERKNVLSALFGFSALLAWTMPRRNLWRIPLLCLLFLMALLSKPTALGFLPILVGLEIIFPPSSEPGRRNWGHWFSLVAPALIGMGILFIGVHTSKQEIVTPPGGSTWTALLTDTDIFSRYIRNILLPVNLSFFYGVDPITSVLDLRLWLNVFFLASVLGGTIWAAGREYRGLAILGIIWFLGALGPTSNIVALAHWMQDRYAYVASAGLLLASAAAVMGLARRSNNLAGYLPHAASICVLLIALCACVRSPLFIDSETLIVDAAQREPSSAMARISAAQVLRARYIRHAGIGPEHDPELATLFAQSALAQYEGIESCADLALNLDSFTLKVRKAELMWSLGRLDEAVKTLGPLPPPNMVMLPPAIRNGVQVQHNMRVRTTGYEPEILAVAWLISGEAALQKSVLPNLQPEERIRASELAISAAQSSIKASSLDDSAFVLQGRALIHTGDLYAAKREMADALKLYNEGVTVLAALGKSSPAYNAAQRILANVPPPVEPPKGK